METIIKKLSDIDTSQGMSLESVKASRLQRLTNALLTTFTPRKAAKKLSSIKELTDETAKDYIDLTCRQIRSTEDFKEVIELASNARGLVRMMPNFQEYLYILGEALIDQIIEHQASEMVHQANVSIESQTNLNDAITQIARLTNFTVGTKEIIRSKIGQHLEKTWTSQELIRSLKKEWKDRFPDTVTSEKKSTDHNLKELSLVERFQLDYQKRQANKQRNKLVDAYRKQLVALGFQGVYDDILPDVFKAGVIAKRVEKAQAEYKGWIDLKEIRSKMHSSMLAKLAPAREETTMLFAHNNPDSITEEEQDEIKYEHIEIKQSLLDRIKAFFNKPDTAPSIKMEDLTISIVYDAKMLISDYPQVFTSVKETKKALDLESQIGKPVIQQLLKIPRYQDFNELIHELNGLLAVKNLTAPSTTHYATQVLPQLREVIRIDDKNGFVILGKSPFDDEIVNVDDTPALKPKDFAKRSAEDKTALKLNNENPGLFKSLDEARRVAQIQKVGDINATPEEILTLIKEEGSTLNDVIRKLKAQ